MSRSKIPSRRPSMITDSKQAWLAKITGRRVQEVLMFGDETRQNYLIFLSCVIF
jgi:hypothetical protein